jgi:DNA helicase-4
LKNPSQLVKNPVSDKSIVNPIIPIRFGKDSDTGGETKEDSLIEALDDIASEFGEHKEVMILGRFNFDMDQILGKIGRLVSDKSEVETDNFKYNFETGRLVYKEKPDMNIVFLTVHKSKGLESDNVIVVNLKDNKMGFPCKIVDDPILDILLSVSEDYDFPEERRLFYVALTRTRNRVYLCTQDDKPSYFYTEIVEDNSLGTQEQLLGESIKNNPKCKRCGGLLVVRENMKSGKQFLGCSNYPYCPKTYNSLEIINNQIECPQCKGYMVKRAGKFGDFYGCTNYPECKGTINVRKY